MIWLLIKGCLLKIPNVPKLGAQYEDKQCSINGIAGHHIYSLKNSGGNVIRSLIGVRSQLLMISTKTNILLGMVCLKRGGVQVYPL